MIDIVDTRESLARVASAEREIFSSEILKNDPAFYYRLTDWVRNFRYAMHGTGSRHYVSGYIAALPFLDKEKDKAQILQYKSRTKKLVKSQSRCDKEIFENHPQYIKKQLASNVLNDLSSFESAIIVVERISGWEYDITMFIHGDLRIDHQSISQK